MNTFQGIFFLQKPVSPTSEQIGCYYFNILQAVEIARQKKAAIVPPLFPLCPRDNSQVEIYHTQPWNDSILAMGTLDSNQVLDYSNVKTLTFEEFVQQSQQKVYMTSNDIEIKNVRFSLDLTSRYAILDMPGRWDLQTHDSSLFFKQLYQTLPLKQVVDIPKPISPLKKPYLGVHWRRGDRGNIIMGDIGKRLWKSTQPEVVASHINKILKNNPSLESVYVSTNSGSKLDRKILQSLVNSPLQFLDKPLGIDPLEYWKWDLYDLFLCSSASTLLLSPGKLEDSSAFGRLIYAEALRKHASVTLVIIPLLDST